MAFSPRGPSGNVRKLIPSSLRNSAAAPKTFAPLRLKTCTSRSGKVDSASNDSPRWSSNANETASADYSHIAVQALCARGHPSPYHSSVSSLTPQSVRQGYWVSSLLSYGFQGNAGLTKPLRPKAHAAIPQLSDPLTGSLSSRLHCTKAQHAYLRDRHLVSYADVIAWTGTGWRPLGLNDLHYDPAHVGKRTVYVQLHCHSGLSPIHSVLGVGTFRISLCVLRTLDHVQWSPTLYQD